MKICHSQMTPSILQGLSLVCFQLIQLLLTNLPNFINIKLFYRFRQVKNKSSLTNFSLLNVVGNGCNFDVPVDQRCFICPSKSLDTPFFPSFPLSRPSVALFCLSLSLSLLLFRPSKFQILLFFFVVSFVAKLTPESVVDRVVFESIV